jgi:hypothetical protein
MTIMIIIIIIIMIYYYYVIYLFIYYYCYYYYHYFIIYIYTHYKLYYILLHIAGTQQFGQLAPKFAKCMAKFYRVWMAQLTQLSPLQLTYIFFGRSVGRILVIHVIVGFSGTPFSDSTISIYIP